MNNLVIIPLIIPFIIGIIMVIFRRNTQLHRWLSVITLFAIFTFSIILLYQVQTSGIQTLQLGGWQAPFGISFVADTFAVLLITTTSIVALPCLVYAFHTIGKDRELFYFYPMFLFLIAGVNGSFLTGDLFNLFVCFELMLISSYVLISMGGKKVQLRESIKYVLINVMSSFLFLIAIAYLYAITGTLNLAHLSVRIAEVGQDGLTTSVAILLFIVFSLKAGLFLFYWLPGSYSAPPTAIAAIFGALLTKVGIYAIFRMFTLVFYHEPQITHLIIGILGALTMVLGAIGAVAHSDIRSILAYNVIIAVGFIIAGLASFTSAALVGSIYYLVHDMIIKALIFLLGGTMILVSGTGKLTEMSGLIRNHPGLGWMFFIAALSLSGIPPLSGFVGKVYISQGTFEANLYWLGAVGLITSLLVLYSIMKVFMNGFWGETLLSKEMEKGSTKGLLLPIGFLTVITIALGLGAEGIYIYVEQAANALLSPELYINAVFGGNPIP
ncbi:Na+/H+ antiporter subunit D [Anaerobacillus isosaccharinicus]|uniref:Na+/H+ antiporter subunit D n=1 Tax=Anaerobacillus isosaccharinicus TaxID=1532552 RepID=A0A1S2L0J3_9BACI|nr:Na+/H+ antiporter subunit D [Anaerobacillus isosaccharinicus]MBA5584820.1 Na+/H+ antiporter subunit D [Anaerobacillus isosaccharinicus]QOY36816.1 Na+/H+ antiporter subunit D [Anaerobacillus isosaccharinicus]